MPQVKAAAIVEILRSDSPQILFAIMATCTVKVAKAKHVRTFESFWIGNCFCLAWVHRLLGDLYAHGHPPVVEPAAASYQQALALAEELGMRPLQAHCHRSLGTLYAPIGQGEQ